MNIRSQKELENLLQHKRSMLSVPNTSLPTKKNASTYNAECKKRTTPNKSFKALLDEYI